MPMKNPPHPGRSIRNACLEPLGLSVTDGAKLLGVTRQALNNVINGKSGISPEMAIRLTKAFGSTPETWLQMQLAYDLAQARKLPYIANCGILEVMNDLPPLPHKPLVWVGRALDELMALPEPVRRSIGFALRFAQAGVKPDNAKPLKGFKGGWRN